MHTIIKEGFLIGADGELEALPKFVQFQNETQSFEVFTMVNANAGSYELALRIGYIDLDDTYSRICTTKL